MKKSTMKQWVILMSTPLLIGSIQYLLAALDAQASWMATVLLVLGMYGGFGLLLADVEWLHQFYQEPSTQTPEHELFSPKYITRSALFMLTLFPLTIFILTSTGSSIGMGMLLGILLGLSLEMFSLRSNSVEFQAQFLSQVKRPFSAEEIEWIALLFCGFSILITLLVVI